MNKSQNLKNIFAIRKTLFVCLVFTFTLSLYVKSGLANEVTASEFVKAATSLENSNVIYDSRYRKISYPLGDVPSDTGVCSDVIIRAYRLVGVDLQRLVHEDMKENFNVYPSLWGLSRTDRNIDHRRVPNLKTFFARHGEVLDISNDPSNYRPGDIVTWNLKTKGSLPHIGIVIDRYSSDKKRPLIMHNIGSGQVIEDILFDYKITGHYRYGIEKGSAHD